MLVDSFAIEYYIYMVELNWPQFNFEPQFAIYVFGTLRRHHHTTNLSILYYIKTHAVEEKPYRIPYTHKVNSSRRKHGLSISRRTETECISVRNQNSKVER